MDLPLLRLIDRAKEFVGSQLREFMSLDKRTGKFDTVPEYPEFAWLEGIVNAVTLRNNIVVRQIRRQDSVLRLVGEDVWAQLDELEQQILTYMGSFNMVSAAQLAAYTGRNKRTINLRLKNLEELGAVRSKGLANDPKRTYSIVRECDA